jgi:hypothetical protein
MAVLACRFSPSSSCRVRKSHTGSPGTADGVRDLREKLSVRTSKPELAAGQSLHLVALFVNCTVMPTTQQREIGERRGAAMRPVMNVMSLADADTAAREATTVVSVVQCAP